MPNKILQTLMEIKLLAYAHKDVLTIQELSAYTGWSASHIYKLTSGRKIPHYKSTPDSKVIHFKRTEIDDWMTAHKVPTVDEIESNFQLKRK